MSINRRFAIHGQITVLVGQNDVQDGQNAVEDGQNRKISIPFY